MYPHLNIHSASTRSHASEEENRSKNCKCKWVLKARLHLQFLLRFLVRFSPSDACERVDELQMFGVHVPSSEHS